MNDSRYDVVIVGAGPAGIFCALELSELDLDILMIEKGHDIDKRISALSHRSECRKHSTCSITCGWGGAGAFSDGKLTLSSEVGGWLNDYVPHEELEALISHVDGMYLDFGAPRKTYGLDHDALEQMKRRALLAELKFVPAPIRHLGTGRTQEMLKHIRRVLVERGVHIITEQKVEHILTGDLGDRRYAIGVASAAKEWYGRFVVLAPGREGAEWLQHEAKRLGLTTDINPVDLGVRAEVPSVVVEDLTDRIYESKLIYHSRSFDDKVRTFCVCPNGEVAMENNEGLLTVNGHSYSSKKTGNTNFALLVSKTFTEPFHEPIAYGKHIARLANLLSGGVIVQRLGDLLSGRRSTPARIGRGTVRPTLHDAVPGDLSLVLPYRYLVDIIEMLKALDKMCHGIYNRNTLLYGVEVKFYSSKLCLDHGLETEIGNLYAIGDGAGLTRGLMQASISGVIAARSIKRRL